jgi:hypothetical protein
MGTVRTARKYPFNGITLKKNSVTGAATRIMTIAAVTNITGNANTGITDTVATMAKRARGQVLKMSCVGSLHHQMIAGAGVLIDYLWRPLNDSCHTMLKDILCECF